MKFKSQKKKGRKSYCTDFQLSKLEELFSKNHNPSNEDVEKISNEINKDVKYIKGWFQRKRNKEKTNIKKKNEVNKVEKIQKLIFQLLF